MFGRSQQPPQTQRIDSSGLAPHQAPPPFEERIRPPAAPYAPPAAAIPPQLPDAAGVPERPVLSPETADISREVRLSKGYQAFDLVVDRLRFRRPTAQDLQTVGVNPFKFSIDAELIVQDVEVNWKAAAHFVSLLSQPPVPPSTVAKFDLDDLDACAGALSRFFMTASAMRISLTPHIGSP